MFTQITQLFKDTVRNPTNSDQTSIVNEDSSKNLILWNPSPNPHPLKK